MAVTKIKPHLKRSKKKKKKKERAHPSHYNVFLISSAQTMNSKEVSFIYLKGGGGLVAIS
jgi:hypothetical protein